jgi:hypothetical protein
MLTFDGTATTALASGARTPAMLMEFDFLSGVQYWTNWSVSLPGIDSGSGGGAQTYVGKGAIFNVSNLLNSENPANEKLRISIPIVNQAMFAAAVGDASQYRNRPMRLYIQVLNSTYQPAGAPVLFYDGVMDKHSIERERAPHGGGAQGGKIVLYCAKRGLSFARRAGGLRLTDAQQRAEFPGDLGAEYIASLIEKPSQWLSQDFQRI